MRDQLVLGIESSCDETSAALLLGETNILGHVILSQDIHRVYGGVVPELAARAHLAVIDDVADEVMRQAEVSLADIDAFGVTVGPGLIGALLVGVCWTKAIAFGLGRPLVPVHHMEAHLFAPSLEDQRAEPPFIALLVSGGHTMLLHVLAWGEYVLLGETRDDAAGEAFDKVAKLLNLPYPGGPEIQRLAEAGERTRHRLPRPMLRRNQRPGDPGYYDFSFSGLKTATVELVRGLKADGVLAPQRPNVAAAFQEAAIDVLATKTLRAVADTGCRRVLIGGGVSANQRLRDELELRLKGEGTLFFSSPRLAADNGAMVARAARFRFDEGGATPPDLSASAGFVFPGLVRGVA